MTPANSGSFASVLFAINVSPILIPTSTNAFSSSHCIPLNETVVIYNKARKNLLECFGDVDIATLTKRDGREFWRWLLKDQDYALVKKTDFTDSGMQMPLENPVAEELETADGKMEFYWFWKTHFGPAS